MPSFIRPKNWTDKPPFGSKINWGHPLATNLVGCFLLNESSGQRIINICDQSVYGAATGSFSWINSFMGTAISGTDASNYIGGTASNSIKTGVKAGSVLWRGYKTGNPANNSLFAGLTYDFPNTSPFVVNMIGTDGGGNVALRYNNNGSFQTASGPAISSYSNNTPLQFLGAIGFSSGQSYDHALYFNNADIEVSGGSTTGPFLYTSTSRMLIGDSASNMVHVCAYFWGRNLSKSEASWLYAEPYAFIDPPKSPVTYYFYNAGVNHALSCISESASQIIISASNAKALSVKAESQGAINTNLIASYALSSIFDSASEVVTLLSHEYNLPSVIAESASEIKPTLGKLHALVVISESATQIKALVGKQIPLIVRPQSASEAQPSFSRVFTGGIADFDIALQMNPPTAALDTGNRPVAFLLQENDNESSLNPNQPNSAPDDSNFFV